MNCSYPTYEEWKLNMSKTIVNPNTTSSYPTYEEWKQYSISHSNSSIFFGSYPTYEEWKPDFYEKLDLVYKAFLSYL